MGQHQIYHQMGQQQNNLDDFSPKHFNNNSNLVNNNISNNKVSSSQVSDEWGGHLVGLEMGLGTLVLSSNACEETSGLPNRSELG